MRAFLIRNGWNYRESDQADAISPERRTGTLAYTVMGLLLTCGFLLIGSFGYNLTAVMIGNLLPWQLDQLGANNTLIALFVTTLPAAIGVVFNPIFSTWSDRTRSRFGRRRPFLFVAAPLIALSLIVLGWMPQLSQWLIGTFRLEQSWIPLALFGGFVCLYNILFMFPCTVLWYLFPDTVPNHYIARYMAFYSMVGQSAGVLFGSFLMPFAFRWTGWLYTGVALFFLLTMWIMLLMVREGDYPPVENKAAAGSIVGALKLYIVECFSIPFYYWFFLAISLSDVSMACRTMFNLLYADKQLGIGPDTYGNILTLCAVTGVVLSVPVGWLADRINPMRLFMLSLIAVVTVNVFSFFLVRDERSFLITSIALTVVYTMQMVSTIPVFVAVLPKANYGQFSSATAIARAVFTAIGGLGGGLFFDYLQNYQYIYAWDFLFTILSLFCFIMLYRAWHKRGGPEHYQAPVYQWRGTEPEKPAGGN